MEGRGVQGHGFPTFHTPGKHMALEILVLSLTRDHCCCVNGLAYVPPPPLCHPPSHPELSHVPPGLRIPLVNYRCPASHEPTMRQAAKCPRNKRVRAIKKPTVLGSRAAEQTRTARAVVLPRRSLLLCSPACSPAITRRLFNGRPQRSGRPRDVQFQAKPCGDMHWLDTRDL